MERAAAHGNLPAALFTKGGRTVGSKPWFAVETKLAASRVDPALRYFRDRLAIPWTYRVTLEGERDVVDGGVRLLPAHVFLGALV